MPKTDLILLHAPSVYDFRKRPQLHGPVSDVVPSTQVFEMYPVGFLPLMAHLRQHGMSVRIANVALRMLRSRRFDAEAFIRSLDPVLFGVDLHWMVHAHGSLELAALVKQHHPGTPVVVGGLSASYYHEELVRRGEVDFVLRGDSTEEPMRLLLQAVRDGSPLEAVPNLTWMDAGGVHVNDLSHVPETLDDASFDYREVMRSCLVHRDVVGHLPFKAWLSYPIVAALSCRGCVHNCAICGGSASAYRAICNRRAPAFRSPELLAADMARVSRTIRAPVIILGDVLQAGEQFARDLLAAMKRQRLRNHVAFEFFRPPPRDFLELVADAVPKFNVQVSPESHDETVRRAFGRAYDNAAFEQGVFDMLDVGCRRVDIFFMIGLPEQTPASVMATVQYCDDLLCRCEEKGYAGKLRPFISPLAPFLDPGGRVFEAPERFGYRLFCRTLEEHRQALLAPSWKHTLNYETRWMDRDALAEATYDAALELNRIKAAHGLVGSKEAQRISERITQERELLGEIDRVLAAGDDATLEARLRELMERFDRVGPSTLCQKDEMNWPSALVRFNPFRLLSGALGRASRD